MTQNDPSRTGTNAFLTGDRVILRPLEEDDAAGTYPTWLNDPETCAANGHHVRPYTRAEAIEYVRSVRLRADIVVLAIVDRQDGVHVGNVSLDRIDLLARTAELTIILGDRRGRGYGTEACRLLVDHGFSALGLERISCGTFETNAGMQRIANELGMTLEGRRRLAAWKDGRRVDVLEYGLLRSEWKADAP